MANFRNRNRLGIMTDMPSLAFFRPKPFLARTEVRIAIASFMILFLELALIRWLSAYILHLAYFSNLVLLASFFGIGLGFLLSARRHVFRYFPYFLLLCVGVVLYRMDISFVSDKALYFQDLRPGRISLPFWLVAPALFAFVASVFVGPSQVLGALFTKTPPLVAYTWDIVGSIAGAISFAVLAAIGAGPVVWFAIIVAAYAALRIDDLSRDLARDAVVFILLFSLMSVFTAGTMWSPYYKLVVYPIGDAERPSGYVLYANETGHQTLQRPEDKEGLYGIPYDFFNDPTYEDVLIIGAGTGSDVARALEKGVAHVDAVDIDPTIVEIGRRLHPSRPYDDPRVTVTVADGRTFLERTDKKYDLIIFALTDSLALASSYSNTRLESYLFTRESFARAKERLAPGGLLVLYNYYREQWLVDKLAGTLGSVFGEPPYVTSAVDGPALAAMMAGPKLADLRADAPPSTATTATSRSPSDEWPFVYLKEPGFPKAYAVVIVTIALIALGAVWLLRRDALVPRGFSWHFFFLGAGFLLLETKNVVNFQLLFGATWLVNALVFIAILGLVLAAVLLTRRGVAIGRNASYAGLFATLALNLLVPLSALSPLPVGPRFVAAALLTLSPVFFANLIFSDSFKKAKRPDACFAANLLGAMAGGIGEYSAMLIGYHWLVAVALAFYAASWLAKKEA